MTAAPRRPMTLDKFLAWGANQPERYEFNGFGPVAWNGGSAAHSTVGTNLIAELAVRLRGKPYRAYGSVLKVLVAGHVRYPDAFVACKPASNDATWITNPVVVFEVLWKSTALIDCTKKMLSIAPPLQSGATSCCRWKASLPSSTSGSTRVGSAPLTDPAAVLAMPEIGIELPLAAFYDGLEFEPN